MKLRVARRSEEDVLRTHRIRGNVTGWFYRADETSNYVWILEGVDVWGRKLAVRRTDPDRLLAEVEAVAEHINEQPEDSSGQDS